MFGDMFDKITNNDGGYRVFVVTPTASEELRVLGLLVEEFGDLMLVKITSEYWDSCHTIGLFHNKTYSQIVNTVQPEVMALVEPTLNILISKEFSKHVLSEYGQWVGQKKYIELTFGSDVVAVYHIHNMSLLYVYDKIVACITNSGDVYRISEYTNCCAEEVTKLIDHLVDNVDFRCRDAITALGFGYCL